MFSDFEAGEMAEISYKSERSGNMVSRTGKILQVPNGEKRGFFIHSGEGQLTSVMGGQVFSLSTDSERGNRSVKRKVHLGAVDSVESV